MTKGITKSLAVKHAATRRDALPVGMSIASHPDEPAELTLPPPDEALAQAHPAPSAEDLEIDGLTDQEWADFERALSER